MIIIGVIGAGRIGKLHIENVIHHVPGVKIKTVADVKIDHLKEWAENLGIPNLTTNHEDILGDSEIKAVMICSSTDTHSRFIVESAQAGKDIFCEKPIDYDIQRIHEALDAVKKAGVKLMIGFNRRFDHNFKRIRESVKKGEIGAPHIIKVTSRDPAPPPIEYMKVSGGLFFDMTIHDFDMIAFQAGEEVQEVYARGDVLIDPEIGKVGDIDTAVIVVKFDSGAMGIIDNSRQAVYGYDQRVEVFGSKGALIADNDKPNTVKRYTDKSILSDKIPYFFLERYNDSYINEMKEFVICLKEDYEPSVGGIDGLNAVLVAKAATKSLKEGRVVKIKEIVD
ncbi:MAG: inositol 2-dehydrogenase [Candidatus Hodarchaeota archaeon]